LAVLFLAVGSAGLFTEVLGRRHYGWALLVALGAAMLGSSVLQWWWRAHGPGRLRAVTPFAAVRPPGGVEDVPAEWRGVPLNLWRVRAVVRDRPGSLAAVCERLAGAEANILGLQVHPLDGDAGVLDEFLVDVPATVTADQLASVVAAAGAQGVRVDRAGIRELSDAPARTLTLAARLVSGQAGLPAVLHDLFGECNVAWAPDENVAVSCEDTTMTLADPDGGTLRVTRDDMAFTPTEFARAQALVGLYGARTRLASS